jgi:hypothetical protein
MERKRFARLLAIVSLVLAGLVGAAAPASASTGVAGSRSATVSVAPAQGEQTERPLSYWYEYGRFQSLGDCKAMGNALVDAGEVINYSCQYWQGEYILWVDAGF